jgi:hypothetical protein
MGLTTNDIIAHRAMLERGDEKQRAADDAAIRDQFAAAALAGILTEDDANCMDWRREQVCREAYNWADAMLAERQRRSALERRERVMPDQAWPCSLMGWHCCKPDCLRL